MAKFSHAVRLPPERVMSKCQSTTSSRKNSAEAASRALAHMSVDSLQLIHLIREFMVASK
jgi:hypothetical protein